MSKQVKLRRGTATEHASFTGVVGEVTVDTTNSILRVHDGATVGGKQIGFGGYQQNTQSSNYTLALSDAAKHIYSTNTGAQTITVPTNASVPFAIGTIVTISNMGTTPIGLSASGVTIIENGMGPISGTPTIIPKATLQLLKTATNQWNVTFGSAVVPEISYFVVAGGGGGGGNIGGGGGGGGVVSGIFAFAAGVLTVTVGSGGATSTFGLCTNGANSSLTGTTTAIGGGYGATNINANYDPVGGNYGGSGGGGVCYGTGGGGTSNQGNAGGRATGSTSGKGGGGGGAGSQGSYAGDAAGSGGSGMLSTITGASAYYAAGGGGGDPYGGSFGGAGGGGNGGGDGFVGTAGAANKGCGGGGGGVNEAFSGGAGGSGVVIISTPIPAVSTTGSPTITTIGGLTIYKFNSSGTITF